jgi:hypothetical protein
MTTPATPLGFGRQYRRLMLGVIVVGIALQFLLALFFLGIGHAPAPRDLPVGVVAGDRTSAVTAELEADGSFAVTPYDDPASLSDAIEQRSVAGGLVVTDAGTTAYTSSAGGALPAATLQALATRMNADAGGPPAHPAVDVVALSSTDTNGATVGYVLQILSLGGAVASLGLGRLIPRAPRSIRRGLGHAAALGVYALASAGILMLAMRVYDIPSAAGAGRLYLDAVLVSLAFTASTAGFVALIGAAGALSGGVYFLIGAPISGATLPWQFLSPFWAAVGTWLPTGGAASVVRNALYYPGASNGSGYLCLALYAGIGVLVILVTNALGNRSGRTSVTRFDLLTPIAGRHRG